MIGIPILGFVISGFVGTSAYIIRAIEGVQQSEKAVPFWGGVLLFGLVAIVHSMPISLMTGVVLLIWSEWKPESFERWTGIRT
jgi:hypothetical protein